MVESGLKHGDDIDDNSGVADCGYGDCDCEDVEIVLWIKEKGYWAVISWCVIKKWWIETMLRYLIGGLIYNIIIRHLQSIDQYSFINTKA